MRHLHDLSFGDPDQGAALPERLRRPMERLFGVGFEAVRVHVGPQAQRLGVPAFNHGSDLYFAPGQFNPDSAQGLRLIGHELAHVRQQLQGRVAPAAAAGSAARLVIDAELEAEADRMGDAAAAATGALHAPRVEIAGTWQWHALQATLKFRNADGSLREFTSAEQAWREIHDNVSGGFQVFFIHAKRDILPILANWISALPGDTPAAWSARAKAGQQRHLLEFGDYTNMARAVMGEFLSSEALDGTETRLARETVNSRYIAAHLIALVDKLRLKIRGVPLLASLLNPATCGAGPYQPLFRKAGANIAKVLNDPDAYYFQDLVVTLHDVSDLLKKKQGDIVKVPPDKMFGTWFGINDFGKPEYVRRPMKGTEAFRYKGDGTSPDRYTLKEHSGFVMAARVQGIPLWAGPSLTTGRMMRMAEWAGASPQELEAVAWGIFAFWNQCYPTSSTWVHRFHEVMDMAVNWGVPFTPFTYPKNIPPNTAGLRSRL